MPSHSDPEDLALRALGEELGPDQHLAGCAHCQSELEQLRGVVGTARTVTSEDQPQEPPPAVWDRVVSELGLSDRGRAGDELAARRNRTRSRSTAVVAAAAALIGIAVGVLGSALVGSSDDEAPGTVLATASLAALPDRAGTGQATLETVGGVRVLALDVSGLTQATGFYEVWLLDKDAKRLVSLGLLDGSTGRFTLPPEVDVSDYPVVDVSIEPTDGNPAHSGDSVVRGVLGV